MPELKSWIIAFRPRTLVLAFSGWLVGLGLTTSKTTINYTIAGLTLLTAIFLQILSNLSNDYGDAISGVDSNIRKGPIRMVQSGAIPKKVMGRSIIIFSLLAFISGISLLYLAFPKDYITALFFLVCGVSGIVAAIKYTVGKNPYGYNGFGDMFVFIFFGIILVCGTYFLQTHLFNWPIVLPATSIGFFGIGILNINNIRDIESDKQSGKMSIPVRIGKKKASIYQACLLEVGMAASIIFVCLDYQSVWELIFVMVNLIFIKNIVAVCTKPTDKLDPHLKQMVLSTLSFAVLFILGQILR